MADPDRDDKVSAGYHALGGEEPPRALDQAILAAARRRPFRWGVPLSLAAVLVLAVGVTLRVQQEEPDVEPVALAPQVMETPRPMAAAPARIQEPPGPAAQSAPAVAADGKRREAMAGVQALRAPLAPEAWLARIVELRKEGRLREAEESLAEFRKRYPDYKIPEALR